MFKMEFLVLFLLALVNSTALSLQPRPRSIKTADLEALAAIKDSLTDMPGTTFFSTWNLTAPDPCSSFSGVTCTLDRVTTLTLGTGLSGSRGLAGSLSPALANLTALTQLILFPGLVTGPIPTLLGRLTELQIVSLTNNRLTGPIPASLSALPNLHTLDLSYNQLSGFIPPGLTRLPRLKILILASNQLSGFLTTISSRLFHLDLKKNEITGRLPPSLPVTLRYLSMAENLLWGPINVLESLIELMYLDLRMNQFSGSIPASLFSPSLSSMLLQRNNFTGKVPSHFVGPQLSSYSQGSIVDLSHNFLSGDLSRALAGVESLFLNNNHFTGGVPEEYVKSLADGTIKTLYLQHNYITGFPLLPGSQFPDMVSLCLSYNCMDPLIGQSLCPPSAGHQMARPASQCSAFNNHSSID